MLRVRTTYRLPLCVDLLFFVFLNVFLSRIGPLTGREDTVIDLRGASTTRRRRRLERIMDFFLLIGTSPWKFYQPRDASLESASMMGPSCGTPSQMLCHQDFLGSL